MSASGHDRTFALHQPMSALPPIATSIVSALLRGSQLIIVFDPVGERGAQGLWAAHPLPSERNGRRARQHHDPSPYLDSAIEIHDIFIREPDASR